MIPISNILSVALILQICRNSGIDMDLLQLACICVIDLCALYHRYTDGHWSRPALSCVAFTHVGLLIHVLLETLKQHMR
ncbi:uncharacterized protein BO66DRAFT_97183 [Aspergillus aculeatinus CBS 121060]|uniref:Uncharacterized protein n=1 Tax=Aspergillus aculeatinus CBS 121060 TaxID=1448322 RepID=A0ACD1H8Z6_9EURO|nr:hypothetical protein BO66DRAFT_97183 [Aspergillus aculeatinus CBS 121060]RAH69864.1 hypothetical protein BO66DRAFT_97183 [Aspergillus aculeatinus CBS 121060]